MLSSNTNMSNQTATKEKRKLIEQFFPKRAEKEHLACKNEKASPGELKAHDTLKQLFSSQQSQ